MKIYGAIIIIFWLIFLLYWVVSAFSTKKTIFRPRNLWRYIFAVIIIIYLLLPQSLRDSIGMYVHLAIPRFIPTNPIVQIIGIILCGLGIAFAIWARRHLGRNWGMPMSLKENPELVTSGPYALVRNPIYTGMLFAVIGSALAIGNNSELGTFWVIVFVCYCIFFIISAKVEEGIMAKEFPDTYPAYKARTKMLIPWVF